VNATRHAGLKRFVFTGVLNAEKAPNVPHFFQKTLIEDYLEAEGVSFVSIRPPGFIDQVLTADVLRSGRLLSPFDLDAKASVILADDVARYLALAVDEPRALNRRIPVAARTPVSFNDIAAMISRLTGRTIRVQSPPPVLMKVMMPVLGLFNPMMRDMPAMMAFISSGDYIGDLTLQHELFDVPETEHTLRRWLQTQGAVLSTTL
jgi:uncharacterized protein YbjT (DUF2867 family)